MVDQSVSKLFNDLETKNLLDLEEAKKRFIELFNSTKEPWLVQGMMDYYNQSHSVRIVDVLVKAPPPHERYIFDRLLDWIKSTHKVVALSLLGHIIMKHPTWLYKVEGHSVFREVLKLLKTEREVIPMMSALLCVITLLPKIPYLMKKSMNDLFEIFSYLAAWNCNKCQMAPGPSALAPLIAEEQLGHLQIGFYLYFQRLYGMFPCNLIEYLKQEYGGSVAGGKMTPKNAIFTHTILPLLEAVRMHPMLITDSPDSEKSDRWRTVAPHDIIAECCKLSVDSCDNHHQSQAHLHHSHISQRPEDLRTIFQLTTTTKLEIKSNAGQGSASATGQQQLPSNYDPFWTPSQRLPFISPGGASLQQSAPPSVTGLTPSSVTVQNTPTNIQIPVIINQPFGGTVGGIGGTSPPEAAVEATPETTPMKDHRINSVPQKTFPPQNSSAVRAIGLGGGDSPQPSSPMKRDSTGTAFRYPQERHVVETTLSRLHTMQKDQTTTTAITSQSLTGTSSSSIAIQGSATVGSQQTVKGDQGVLAEVAAGSQAATLTDKDTVKCELSQSPCSVGGLHMPNSRSIQEFRHFVALGQGKEQFVAATSVKVQPTREEKERSKTSDEIEVKTETGPRKTSSCAAQTEDLDWQSSSAPYDPMFRELALESKFKGATLGDDRDGDRKKAPISPHEILDSIIEAAVAKKKAHNAKDMDEFYKSQIQLLSYQLLFERHQREVHAERNRRLFGKSRDYKVLELNNETLKKQVQLLMDDVENHKIKLYQVQAKNNAEKMELSGELKQWKAKFSRDQDEIRVLRQALEQCQNRLAEEETINRDRNHELERAKGELFDLQHEKSDLTHQASLGQYYQGQVTRLQSEFVLMGELHQQWREKLCELEQREDRDREMELTRCAYEQELDEAHTGLRIKSSQLETAQLRVMDLEQGIAKRDSLVADQKRLLKTAKEEYEEKFEALEKKYETQKAIILKMEEHLLELYRNPGTCPDSLRSEMVSSAEHASPLSLSLTSSDGLSTSVKSVTEKPGPSTASAHMVGSTSSQTLI